jgi:hypothetical protein
VVLWGVVLRLLVQDQFKKAYDQMVFRTTSEGGRHAKHREDSLVFGDATTIEFGFSPLINKAYIIAVLLAVSSCSMQPQRPDDVPITAEFNGGPKGGKWVDCVPDGAYFQCSIYGWKGGLVRVGQFQRATDAEDRCYRLAGQSYHFDGTVLWIRHIVAGPMNRKIMAYLPQPATDEDIVRWAIVKHFKEEPARVSIAPATDICLENRDFVATMEGEGREIHGLFAAGHVAEIPLDTGTSNQ